MTLDTTYPRAAPEQAPIPEARATRDLAIMFADIADSTGLYESLGDARAHRVVAATLQRMTDDAQACGGRIIKTVGDALLCAYPSATDAARGAIAIQKTLLGLQLPEADRVAVRIGFNFGPVVEARGDVFGDSVNVAARLVQIAQRHQILTTATCIERLSAAHRFKARELQLIVVRGRTSHVPIWELLWRSEEQLTQRIVSPARRSREGFLIRLEFHGRGCEVWREGGVLTMGRDDASHVQLDGLFVSRRHARIVVRNGRFILIDESTNGTYVLPESGETVAVMREEYVLSGSGLIGLGRLPTTAGNESVRYATRARAPSHIADIAVEALAADARAT